jgi:alpha-galactosidase
MTREDFRREVGERYGCANFQYFANAEKACAGVAELDSLKLADLCKYARVTDSAAAALADPKARMTLHHGWQSWSMAKELAKGERVFPARFVTKLNIYAYRPLHKVRRGEIEASFFGYFRAGDDYLAFVSRNSGGAPITFRIARRSGEVSVELYAPGKRFSQGEKAAELCVFHAKGPFELKDKLKAIFADFKHFDKLSFLGDPSSPRLVPGGYESWYNHYWNIDEKIILSDLDGIGANANLINELYLKRGRPTVFQVDDGWEVKVGDWRVNGKFPNGMKAIADAIKAKGMIPGIWIAPFIITKGSKLLEERPEWLLHDAKGDPVVAGWMPHWGKDFWALDLSRPEVEEYLVSTFRTLVEEWGYRFLKLDFLYAGMLPGAFANGGSPHEHYERVLGRLVSVNTTKDGQPVAFLGCGAPLENSFRHLPLMRIGADTKEEWDGGIAKFLRHQCRPSAKVSMLDTIGRAPLDGSVFVNDPDVVFCRDTNMKLTEAEKELVAAVDFALASQVMFSDDPVAFSSEAEFTRRLVDLHDSLAGRELAAVRVAPDVFRLSSRDGAVAGYANLSEGEFAVPDWPSRAPLLTRGRVDGSTLYASPRSISLFEAGSAR